MTTDFSFEDLDLSPIDDVAEGVMASRAEHEVRLATAAVEPIWPYLAASASRSDFTQRLAMSESAIDRAISAVTKDEMARTAARRALVDRYHDWDRERLAQAVVAADRDVVAAAVSSALTTQAGYAIVSPKGEHLWGMVYDTEEGARAHHDTVKNRTDDMVPRGIKDYTVKSVDKEPNRTYDKSSKSNPFQPHGSKTAGDFASDDFAPSKWYVYRVDHTGRGIPVEGTDFTSKEQAEVAMMGLKERERINPLAPSINPSPVHYLVAEDAKGMKLPYNGEHWKSPFLSNLQTIAGPTSIETANDVPSKILNGIRLRLDGNDMIGWMEDWGAVYDLGWLDKGWVEAVDHNSGGYGGVSYKVTPAGKKEMTTAEEKTSSFLANLASMQKGAPFAGYEDFAACVAANSDKDDPEAYCGKIKHDTEDKKTSSKTAAGSIRWVGDTHMGVGFIVGLADNDDVYEVYFNPNMNPTPCAWARYGPEGDTGMGSQKERAGGFTTMQEAMRAAEANAAGAKTAEYNPHSDHSFFDHHGRDETELACRTCGKPLDQQKDLSVAGFHWVHRGDTNRSTEPYAQPSYGSDHEPLPAWHDDGVERGADWERFMTSHLHTSVLGPPKGYQPSGEFFDGPCDVCGEPVKFEWWETSPGGFRTSYPVEEGAGSDYLGIWCENHTPRRYLANPYNAKVQAAKSDQCPKCKSTMTDVKVYGDTMKAKCSNCGWSGTKTKPKTSAVQALLAAEHGDSEWDDLWEAALASGDADALDRLSDIDPIQPHGAVTADQRDYDQGETIPCPKGHKAHYNFGEKAWYCPTCGWVGQKKTSAVAELLAYEAAFFKHPTPPNPPGTPTPSTGTAPPSPGNALRQMNQQEDEERAGEQASRQRHEQYWDAHPQEAERHMQQNARRRQALNEQAQGTERYQSQPTLTGTHWDDAWDAGKAPQEMLDQGRAAYEPENPFAKRLVDTRKAALRILAEGDPGNLEGFEQADDFGSQTKQPLTTRPRVMPSQHQEPSMSNPPLTVSQAPAEPMTGGGMGGMDITPGEAVDVASMDPTMPTVDQMVAAKIARVAVRVLVDNPSMSAVEAKHIAAMTVARFPEMVKG